VSTARQASAPRSGPGPRQPAGPRRPGGRAAGQATPEARLERSAQPESTARATAAPLDAPAQLSSWQQVLEEIDRLLRDPRLTRALKAFWVQVASVARGLPAAAAAAAKAVARTLARIRLPRRALLALLALLLPLALLALLMSSDDDPGARRAAAAAAPTPAAAGLSLPPVGMPQLRTAPDHVRPVRVALVVDRTYDRPALRRELRALGAWLGENHASATRVAVIDAPTARASRPLDAAHLAGASPTRQRASTTAAVRSELSRGGRRLLVTLGGAATPRGTPRALRIATRPGASAGSSAALAYRRRSRVTIDERRPNALAAEVARAVMAVSGERERR
jgi:hypothetical protein